MKKIGLILGGILVALVAAFFFVNSGPPKSPPGSASYSDANLDVKVSYHRPFKKGRVIFGEKDAGALVPNGKYWRLGANASTDITFAKNVVFGGKPITAGTYRMYAIPGATSWQVILNSATSRFGAMEPSKDKDVLTVEAPVEKSPDMVEQFTINIAAAPPGAQLEFRWDTTLVKVSLAAGN